MTVVVLTVFIMTVVIVTLVIVIVVIVTVVFVTIVIVFFLCFISGPSYSHSLGGGGVTRLRFCPIFTLIISLTAGSTSPFPHLFSIR